MLKKSKNRKLVFRRFLISYMLILVLPITLGSIIYYNAVHIIEKDEREARMFMLKQSCMFVDNYFKDIEGVVLSISLDSQLENIIYMDPPGFGAADIYNVIEEHRKLGSYSFSTSFESSFYVFLKQPDVVFAHNGTQRVVDFGIKRFFDHYIQYGDLTYEEWYDSILNRYHKRTVLPAGDMSGMSEWITPVNCIAYIQSIPINTQGISEGAIEVLIRTEGINKLLSAVDEQQSGWTYILDNDGQLLTGVTNGQDGYPGVDINLSESSQYMHQKINGKNMVIMTLKSDYNGWTYVTIMPQNVIMVKANYIKGIIFIVVGLSLVVGLIVSYLLSRRNIKPITEVILTLRSFLQGEMDRGENEYECLKYGINRLIDENEDMKATVDNQAILLKSSFLGMLIKGEFYDQKELEMQRNHLEIPLEGDWFATAIVDFQTQNDLKNKEQLIEQDIYRLILDRTLSHHLEKEGYTYILNPTRIVAVMSFANRSRSECLDRIKVLIETIRSELIEVYDIYVDFYVGSPFERLIDVSLSYNEAVNLLDYYGGENPGKQIALFWEENLENAGYYYPLELEQKLINLTIAGNRDEIMRILDSIYKENFENRILSSALVNHLLYDMRATLLKAMERVKFDLDVKDLFSSKQCDMQKKEGFDVIRRAYEEISERACDRKKSHNSSLLDKLLAYIGENYRSQNISVSSVAAEFGISESYFSQFFKEQSGEAFSSYVEKLRINHAGELLKNENYSIENIAGIVGYNSAYSFRRAFKRVTGMLPTEYKE